MHSNFVGFDGTRTFYDGQAMIFSNGKCLACTNPFSLKEVELAVASVDLNEIDIYRTCLPSRNIQAGVYINQSFSIVKVNGFNLKVRNFTNISPEIRIFSYSREEQVLNVPACYLWDYLRRSTASGFFINLNENIESASVLLIISAMCELVLKTYPTLIGYNQKIMKLDLERIFGSVPDGYKEMMQKVVFTAYLSSFNTTESAKLTAEELANEIGSTHLQGSIDDIYNAYIETFTQINSFRPKTAENGGSFEETIGLQALECRIRMVVSYISGQLLTFSFGRKGFLIVLGTTSLEKNLIGDHTKYGSSSGDINPVGCISKIDLINLAKKFSEKFCSLNRILEKELCLNDKSTDGDLELNIEELKTLAKLRKIEKLGPYSSFVKCCEIWNKSPEEIATKVKKFFVQYATNRHKMTVLTPMLAMDASIVDDNRYDLRQLLYNLAWTTQFDEIDKALEEISAS